jgi:membrane-associated protein
MGSVVDHLLSAPTALVYVLVGSLVFTEDALFIGFVLPGETAAILGGSTPAGTTYTFPP